jgi:hypothetical protein
VFLIHLQTGKNGLKEKEKMQEDSPGALKLELFKKLNISFLHPIVFNCKFEIGRDSEPDSLNLGMKIFRKYS